MNEYFESILFIVIERFLTILNLKKLILIYPKIFIFERFKNNIFKRFLKIISNEKIHKKLHFFII